MEKDIQSQIDYQKNKLMSLIQTLVTTQSLKDERAINNQIKKESEYLNSLLDMKQNALTKQFNINNEIYDNPIKLEQPKIKSDGDQLFTINLKFYKTTGITTILQCKPIDRISDVINRYRVKANDFEQNRFDYNYLNLNKKLNCSLIECGIKNGDKIIVSSLRTVIGQKNSINFS